MKQQKKRGDDFLKKLQIAREGYILISIVLYISGIICILLPQASYLLLCIISGIIFIAYGSIKIIGYFSDDLYCLAFQHDFASGLFLIVLGAIALGYNSKIQDYLSIGIGGSILLDSLLKIQTSGDAKKFGLKNWYWILIISLITGIFGFLTIMCTFQNEMPIRLIVGSALISEGFMSHYIIHNTVKKREERLLSYKIINSKKIKEE